MVARAQPDGYTLLFASPGVLATNRFMYKAMPFDADRAFEPVILFAKSPLIIVANPRLPVRDLFALIDHARANPGKTTVGIPSVGSQAHLTMELLAKQSGTKMTYVPYRGGANVNTDLMGGQIDVGINFVPGLVGPVNQGALRGLAVTTTARSKQFPDVPTVDESGFRGFELVAWYSIVAPAGTPRAVVDKLNALDQRIFDQRARPPPARAARHAAGRRNARGSAAPISRARSPNGAPSSRRRISRCSEPRPSRADFRRRSSFATTARRFVSGRFARNKMTGTGGRA